MDYLELPKDLRPSSLNFSLSSNVKSSTSPWTGATQTIGFGGSHWVCDLSFSGLNDAESRIVESVIYQIDGMRGRIKIADYGREGVKGVGSPQLSASAQSGALLSAKGFIPSKKVMSVGDYLTINNELKFITSDVYSDSSGNATIRIAPDLRTFTAAGSRIEVESPYGIFMLSGNSNGVSRRPAFVNSISLKFREAF